MAQVSFSNNNPTFSVQLRKRVDEYFSRHNLSFTGNRKLYMKTVILLLSAATIYTLLVFVNLPVWLSIALCVVMGFNLAGIGFNVMHDGAHGSYSQKRWVNETMAYSLNLLGGCSYLWKIKHNVNHHSFTNIEGMDDDIDIQPWIRTNENQPRKWFHKYQHIYWAPLYGLAYISWVFIKDFKKYFTGKIATTTYRKMSTREHIIFWTSKLAYTFLFIAVPVMKVGVIETVVGYTITAVVCGFVLSIIFQLAHVVEGSSFPLPAEQTNRVEQDWTIHQLATTANFSTRSKVISWFAGGLNFQVEHHLFPRISHVHYPEINKVVKDVCSQFNVQYMEHESIFGAIRSHVAYLKMVGQQ